MSLESINPATDELMQSYEELGSQEIDDILTRVNSAYDSWKLVTIEERARLMKKAASLLRSKKTEYGTLMTLEMGKPITEAEAEAEKCAWVCDYYAEQAVRFLSDEIIETSARRSYVRFDPIGPVLAVMPWNFPFWQVFRFAAPALMAGNVGLLKHASNVPQCAIAIESVFREAGFPEHVFRTLLISSKPVASIIQDDRVKAVTLTGSEFAGSDVAGLAGRALKKSVLELGGSDPFIILKDADLQQAVEQAVTSRLLNAGQSCIAAKRFIVEKEVAADFENLFTTKMREVKTGDPLDYTVRMGPLARHDLRDELDQQVNSSVLMGAHILCGGKKLGSIGVFYEPTVMTTISPEMPVFKEETFGPVPPIIRADNEVHAISIANNSPLGLGSSIWTRDIEKAQKLAAMIETGNVFINSFVKSDPRLPFGGIKKSGYGRELSHYGIKEFVNIKTVWIEK